MSNFLERIFHIKEKGSNIGKEILGGAITFIAICYILPVNAGILSAMGMSTAGVFAMTAILSCVVTLIMAFVANYPITLSTGMGLNAYLAYTLSGDLGFNTWQQRMILLTITGIIFFVFSLTPIRKIIIEAIPKKVQLIISMALGGFIALVGLKSSGIISANSSTLVQLTDFDNPGVVIALVGTFIGLAFMFCKNKMLSQLGIPAALVITAIAAVITTAILQNKGVDSEVITGTYNLPLLPWTKDANVSWGISGVDQVFAYGLLGKDAITGEALYSVKALGDDLVTIFTNPASYIAIFSLMFVNLFDTTATLLAVGSSAGFIDENGKMQNYRKAVIADATGALICGPCGTSTLTSFAESNIAIEMGARTGLAATTSALLFLLSAFIYPIFSIFTAGCVTAPALICVGVLIMFGAAKNLDFTDMSIAFVTFLTLLFTILTYSLSTGIGIGIISYIVICLAQRRYKEINIPLYAIGGLFIVSFILTALMKYV